jgi:anti-sigma B factor antagonist
MQIDKEQRDGIAVLRCKGKMTLGEGDELLRDAVQSTLNEGTTKIVLDLSEVPYIDSAGLGEIVRSYSLTVRQEGTVVLVGLTKRIEDLLSITKLMTVFQVFESTDQAIAALREKSLS